MRYELDSLPRDARIAALATERHGILSLAEMATVGLDRSAVHRRVRAGRLHRVGRGVYAVGHPRMTPHGRLRAAVLACGEDALLSHAAAAAVHGLRAWPAGRLDVTIPTQAGRTAPDGVRLHRSASLTEEDLTRDDHLPRTSWARTLVDLAGTLDRERLRAAVNEAEVRRLFDLPVLERALERRPRSRGAGRLREIIDEWHEVELSPTELEHAMAALCRTAGLPRPVAQPSLHGFRPDFWWPDHGLVVEMDSWTFHRTRARFESDRARDAALLARGIRTVRVTHRQVTGDPAGVARTLAACLRRPT